MVIPKHQTHDLLEISLEIGFTPTVRSSSCCSSLTTRPHHAYPNLHALVDFFWACPLRQTGDARLGIDQS